jgi:hypothetical protein
MKLAAATPVATAAMALRCGGTGRHGERASDQDRDCKNFHEFRHG